MAVSGRRFSDLRKIALLRINSFSYEQGSGVAIVRARDTGYGLVSSQRAGGRTLPVAFSFERSGSIWHRTR